MLILTRRVDESLVIGDNVTVTILGVKGSHCVLVLMRRGMSQFIVKSSRKSRTLESANFR